MLALSLNMILGGFAFLAFFLALETKQIGLVSRIMRLEASLVI
ncbi:hypothetical protein ABFY09_14545 [Marinomonas sp. 5E14-1]